MQDWYQSKVLSVHENATDGFEAGQYLKDLKASTFHSSGEVAAITKRKSEYG